MKSNPAIQRRRLKYVATINDEALTEDTSPDYEIQYIDIGNVDSQGTIHEVATYRLEDAPSRARRRVRDGDVIISTVRTYLQAIAPIHAPPENLIVSTGFAVVRPRPGVLERGFCRYALREPSFLAEVERRSVGVSYPAINASDLGNIETPLPALADQRLITAFLDRETARIDQLIAAKERLLAMLAEKRRALITRAVTRGLDASAPLRDSGVPWLGEVPAGWRLARLKFLADVRGGLTLGQNYGRARLVEYPYLRVANVQAGRLDLSEVTTVWVPSEEAVGCTLRTGDVLMTEGGDIDKLGRGCVWRDEIPGCLHQNHVFAVRPHSVRSEWLTLWTAADGPRSYFETRAKRSTNLASISATNIGELPVLVPSDGEQLAIIAAVAHAHEHIDALDRATQWTIGFLTERRRSLIAAAVTGAIQPAGGR